MSMFELYYDREEKKDSWPNHFNTMFELFYDREKKGWLASLFYVYVRFLLWYGMKKGG